MPEKFIKQSFVAFLLCLSLVLVPNLGLAREFVLVSLEYLPYSQRENGVLKGFDIEILQECFRRMGVDLKIELVPWKRALSMAMHSHVDGIFGALKTPARIEKLYYSDPYRSEQISLFVRRNSKLVFDGNLEKIKDHSFGVIRDFSYGKKLDKFLHTELEKRRVEWVVDTERNIAKLIKGRFDILIADHFSAMHTIRNMKVKGKIRSLEPPVTDNNIYVAFSRKRKLAFLRDHFNMALRSMREDGTLDLIMKKYVD